MKYLLPGLFLTLGIAPLVHAGNWGEFAWGTGKWSSSAAISGACGSGDGKTVTTSQSTNLCSAGVASNVTGAGPWSWSCSGVNGGTTASCSAERLEWVLTAHVVGTGSGSINGNVSCISGGVCSPVTFPHGAMVTLTPTADAFSTFGGWSGACSNLIGNCSISMDREKNVTATFNAAPKAKVSSKQFDSLQSALDDATTGTTVDTSVIKLLQGRQDGDITAAGKVVMLQGGHNAAYTDISSETIIHGRVRIKSGTIRMNRLKIK